MEILVFIFIEIILTGIGWLCLFIWYRDKRKVKEIRDKKYAGEYSAVPRILILHLIAGIGAITMFSVVIYFLGVWIYRAIVN